MQKMEYQQTLWRKYLALALTFGAAGQTSAPGQIEDEKLRGVLEIFH